MANNLYTVTDPQGKTHSRRSARIYTHAVLVLVPVSAEHTRTCDMHDARARAWCRTKGEPFSGRRACGGACLTSEPYYYVGTWCGRLDLADKGLRSGYTNGSHHPGASAEVVEVVLSKRASAPTPKRQQSARRAALTRMQRRHAEWMQTITDPTMRAKHDSAEGCRWNVYEGLIACKPTREQAQHYVATGCRHLGTSCACKPAGPVAS